MTGCSMESLVEAAHDERLGARERSSMARHLATCATCRQHADELRELRDLARTLVESPTEPIALFEHHRGRVRLLKEAALPKANLETDPMDAEGRSRSPSDRALIGASERPRMSRRWALGLALVTGVLGTIGVRESALFHRQRAIPAAGSLHTWASGLNLTVVGSDEGTQFVRSRDGELELVTLTSGTVHVRVHHLLMGERFVVRTGDAEVEVRGTRFDVVAKDGALERVSVAEGFVELRRAGETRLLPAGTEWLPPVSASSDSPNENVSDTAARIPASTGPSTARGLSSPMMKASPHTKTGPSTSSVKKAPSPDVPAEAKTGAPVDEAEAFRTGMARLEKGDFGQAAADLGRFAANHPDDPRAEDAAFLEILSLSRAGRPDDARAAARAYLDRFPNGYRRAEAEKLLQKH